MSNNRPRSIKRRSGDVESAAVFLDVPNEIHLSTGMKKSCLIFYRLSVFIVFAPKL